MRIHVLRTMIIGLLFITVLLGKSKYDIIFSPMFGYNPAAGFITGGGIFVSPTRHFDYDISTRLRLGIPSLMYEFSFDLSKNNALIDGLNPYISTNINNADMLYYAGNKQSDDPLTIKRNEQFAHIGVDYQLNSGLFAGIYSKAKIWSGISTAHRNSTNGYFSNDVAINLGIRTGIDTRDHKNNTQNGIYTNISAETTYGITGATRIGADLRGFLTLFDTTFGVRATGGYLTEEIDLAIAHFALGGQYNLRGVKGNRLRGNKFYLAQAEIRRYIMNASIFPMDGVVFAEYGDAWTNYADNGASTNLESNPIVTYGLGLRFGIPPSSNTKIRADFGLSSEGTRGFYVTFKEAF